MSYSLIQYFLWFMKVEWKISMKETYMTAESSSSFFQACSNRIGFTQIWIRQETLGIKMPGIISTVNPFPHIDAFWRLCSRRLFENIVTKEEIAQNVQFLLLLQCFTIFVICYPFNYRDCPCFDKICSKSSAAELSYEGKG